MMRPKLALIFLHVRLKGIYISEIDNSAQKNFNITNAFWIIIEINQRKTGRYTWHAEVLVVSTEVEKERQQFLDLHFWQISGKCSKDAYWVPPVLLKSPKL